MARRLIACLLGTLLGIGIGAGFVQWTRVAVTPELGLVLAMATAGCTSALFRRAPWRQQSAVESLLWMSAGMALGAAFELTARRFLDHVLPSALPPLPVGVTWLEHPILLCASTGALVGLVFGIEPSERAAAVATSSSSSGGVSSAGESMSARGTGPSAT